MVDEDRLRQLQACRVRPYVSQRSLLEAAGFSREELECEMRRLWRRQLGDWLGRPYRGRN
jgi:hypothetical protein